MLLYNSMTHDKLHSSFPTRYLIELLMNRALVIERFMLLESLFPVWASATGIEEHK
jgi:hypothetical protein